MTFRQLAKQLHPDSRGDNSKVVEFTDLIAATNVCAVVADSALETTGSFTIRFVGCATVIRS